MGSLLPFAARYSKVWSREPQSRTDHNPPTPVAPVTPVQGDFLPSPDRDPFPGILRSRCSLSVFLFFLRYPLLVVHHDLILRSISERGAEEELSPP